jgi:perosamine synthetase
MKELELTKTFFESNPHHESWAHKEFTRMKVPLSKPSYLPYIGEVSQEVDKVLRSGMIAQGAKVAEFEQMVADYYGAKYAIAVSSGTAGLYMCLKACGIGPGDEVITSPYTFIATVFAIESTGAKPVFCDVDRDTYNIDTSSILDELQSNMNIRAIMPVDILGLPVNTNKLLHYIPFVLDSCESFGNKIDRPFDAMVFGLYPNKIIGTGEGGLICTNNKDINDYCKAYRNQGRSPGDTWLESSIMGFNYRMTDLQATIGIVQMKHIYNILERRKRVVERYGYNGIIPSQRIDTEKFSPFVFVVETDDRPKVMEYLANKGIDSRAYFPCVHLQQPYLEQGYTKGMYPVAEKISEKTLAIPYYTGMTDSEVDYVCDCLKDALSE